MLLSNGAELCPDPFRAKSQPHLTSGSHNPPGVGTMIQPPESCFHLLRICTLEFPATPALRESCRTFHLILLVLPLALDSSGAPRTQSSQFLDSGAYPPLHPSTPRPAFVHLLHYFLCVPIALLFTTKVSIGYEERNTASADLLGAPASKELLKRVPPPRPKLASKR